MQSIQAKRILSHTSCPTWGGSHRVQNEVGHKDHLLCPLSSNAPSCLISYFPLQEKWWQQCYYRRCLALLNFFVLKKCRPPCFYNSLILFIYCCFHHFSWHYITHPAAYEYRFPVPISKVVTQLHWWRPQMHVHPEYAGKCEQRFVLWSC